jgi:hypothetical protein
MIIITLKKWTKLRIYTSYGQVEKNNLNYEKHIGKKEE